MKELTRRQIELLKQDIPLKMDILEKRIIDCVFNDLKDNVKLYTIMKELDKTKAYDLRDLSCEQKVEVFEKMRDQSKYRFCYGLFDTNFISFEKGENWHTAKCLCFLEDREVINALTLFEPQLKVGDTFEHEGVICEVKSKIIKWYVVDRGLDTYYTALTEEAVLWIRSQDIRVEEITDQEFIKQLEKHAR